MTGPLSRDKEFPPAPWQARGHLWMSVFKTDKPVKKPEGIKYLLHPRWLVVTVVRYLEGTLKYDELVVGPLVHLGSNFGIWVDRIWVDSAASMRGGREIWGVPKEMATFIWEKETVHISHKTADIAKIRVDTSSARFFKLKVSAPGIGSRGGLWLFSMASLKGKLGRSGMQILEWSDLFGYTPRKKAMFGFAVKPFEFTMHKPHKSFEKKAHTGS